MRPVVFYEKGDFVTPARFLNCHNLVYIKGVIISKIVVSYNGC